MPIKKSNNKPKCGLCGNSKKLTKTICCNNWICDDYDSYVLFSYDRNSCHRNHDRYTLCSYHHNEGHKDKWQDCIECKGDFDTPNYNELVTNEYNFETIKDIKKVKIKCSNCKFTADDLNEFAFQTSRGYFCCKEKCQEAAMRT